MAPNCGKSFLQCCYNEFQKESNGHNFSNGILPSLGATINQSTKLRKYIVSPFNSYYSENLGPTHSGSLKDHCGLTWHCPDCNSSTRRLSIDRWVVGGHSLFLMRQTRYLRVQNEDFP
ncbi:Potassium channel KAT2 [Platanthera guangdongensis]|uniref:Potassium channel KAT2 n=1 Tax=Platanthera guangdongensis TaxID=2320717 RepID=A0ABR2MEG1_9ASPA